MSHSKCSKKSLKPLKDELKDYRKQGVRLFLNGNPSTPKCIANYTADEEGRIAKVNFEHIRELPKNRR